jgi:DNA-directed RNA polymerase specialized sigma24 family protein
MADAATGTPERIDEFMADARVRLERALVARFGVDDGIEAAQDAVLYAMENWERVAAMENPVGYLYRVGQTAGRRRAQRWGRLGLLAADPVTTDDPLDVDLQRALLQLRAEQRVAVLLVHGHGHSYAEAAAVLDVPTTTVTNHLHRGVARLRSILEEPS